MLWLNHGMYDWKVYLTNLASATDKIIFAS